jgi:hypothetical protein
MDVIIAFLSGVIVGAVVMLFVYRNNKKDISPVADKVDGLYDKVEDLAEKLKNLVDKK